MRGRQFHPCSVVASHGCKAPANAVGLGQPRLGQCFRCGNDVCTDEGCSRRVSYLAYGRRRLCLGCLEEEAKA